MQNKKDLEYFIKKYKNNPTLKNKRQLELIRKQYRILNKL
jgi:hypothetical protein